YAEIYCVSSGSLSGKAAIELRSKVKTLNLVSAAVAQIDEVRTTFVDPESGSPLYISRTDNSEGLPKETISDFRQTGAASLDLLSLIYKIRHLGGSGTANVQVGEKVYSVAFSPSGTEKVTVPAGDWDTSIISVQSDYFTEQGFVDVKINLTADEAKVPVLIRLNKTKKSGYRVEAASIQTIVPDPPANPTPTPTPAVPVATPRPTATPEPYVPNQALAPELAFQLGETLEYRVTAGGRPVGTFVTRARERVQVAGRDTLILSLTVTNASPGNPILALNDSIVANVDPVSLAPYTLNIRMAGPLASLTQSVIFDDRTGSITFKGTSKVDAPIATHSILSLVYAMRSFNLKPSKVRDNPVNDTRVAVFWDSRPYVFTLRPSAAAEITVNGEKRQAQLITINTGNRELDQLGLKVWLSVDATRVPLRFSAGQYQADLVSVSTVAPTR
ncbi:MAG TPA: DUF3108 domain-containing protein, partial [Pyrinomonadaceae bacterium]|nr:DUF3108 domain-containing protein [Pyrinomonadaceae bacterium]